MSIIQSTAKSGTGGFYDYPIENSLRFDGSSYLSRTSDSNGNSNTWTYSLWVKRSALDSDMHLLSEEGGGHATNTNISFCSFRNTNILNNYSYYSGGNIYDVRSTAVYRDTNAWYHIVFVLDLTNGTAGDREAIYVNGKLVSDNHITDGSSSNPSRINSGNSVLIGNESARYRYPFKGYLANIQFIDGQALDPYFFGESKNGVWIPYNAFSTAGSGTATASDGDTATDSYGTNGFHLTFEDATSTTTLGYDYSGNNNHWTLN